MTAALRVFGHSVRFVTIGAFLVFASCGCPFLNIPPKGPFEFIGETKPFFFDSVGNTKEFTIEISDMANYELALIAEETQDCIFPNDGTGVGVVDEAPLQWALDVSVWHDASLLDHRVLRGMMEAKAFEGNSNCLEIVQVGLLPALRVLFGTKRFLVQVTVLAVDERYTDRTIPVRVGIRRSPRI